MRWGAIGEYRRSIPIWIKVGGRDRVALTTECLEVSLHDQHVVVPDVLIGPSRGTVPSLSMPCRVIGADPAGILEAPQPKKKPAGINGHDQEDGQEGQDEGELDQALASTVGREAAEGHADDSRFS